LQVTRAADLDAGGLLGPGAEHRPALEVLAGGVAVERVEVIPVEDHVDAEVLGLGDGAADGGVVGVLGLDLEPDADSVICHPPDASAAVGESDRIVNIGR